MNYTASFSARQVNNFYLNFPKRTFCSYFVKFSSEIHYLFLAGNGRLFVICCCNTSDFDFFLVKALITLKKMLTRKKLFDVRLGNASTPLGTQIPQIYKYAIELTSRRKIRNRQTFFQNEVQNVLYKESIPQELPAHIMETRKILLHQNRDCVYLFPTTIVIVTVAILYRATPPHNSIAHEVQG